jgi:hypothetical protein
MDTLARVLPADPQNVGRGENLQSVRARKHLTRFLFGDIIDKPKKRKALTHSPWVFLGHALTHIRTHEKPHREPLGYEGI